jgi:hydrogenase maturation protease
MTASENSVPVVVGVGNPFRGDDAIGLIIVRQLKLLLPDKARIEECEGEGTYLLELWKDKPKLAIVVDAVCSGGVPGTFYRFDATHRSLPASLFKATSSHSIGVAEAIEMARVLDYMPSRLIVYGVEARQFELGSDPSPEVEKAAEPVLRCLKVDLTKFGFELI